MGLFDSLAGQVLSSLSGSAAGDGRPAGLVEAVGQLIGQHPGGLGGLVEAFERGGLGGVAASWVGSGANLPISAEQLQAVLGNEQIAAIAQRLGLSPQEASSHLAELLPQCVDRLTPGGALPEGGALGHLLGVLQGTANR